MPRQGSVIKLSKNDELSQLVDKCNWNFDSLSRVNLDGASIAVIKDQVDIPIIDAAFYDQLFDMMYPVGAGIWTNRLDDPRMERGTWAQLKDVFLLAAGTKHANKTTGGKEQVTLTTNQMPTHTHTATASTAGDHKHQVNFPIGSEQGSPELGVMFSPEVTSSTYNKSAEAGSHTHTITVGSTGGGQPFDIMPPYAARYYFERTA